MSLAARTPCRVGRVRPGPWAGGYDGGAARAIPAQEPPNSGPRTALQKHVDFFDSNHAGRIMVAETYACQRVLARRLLSEWSEERRTSKRPVRKADAEALPYRHDAVKASDHDIKEAVEAALKTHKTLDGIKVESVDNGVVLLKGKTTSLDLKLVAIETAYNCAGTRRVASMIETDEK